MSRFARELSSLRAVPDQSSPWVRGNAAAAAYLGWGLTTFKRVRRAAQKAGKDPARFAGERVIVFRQADLDELALWWFDQVAAR